MTSRSTSPEASFVAKTSDTSDRTTSLSPGSLRVEAARVEVWKEAVGMGDAKISKYLGIISTALAKVCDEPPRSLSKELKVGASDNKAGSLREGVAEPLCSEEANKAVSQPFSFAALVPRSSTAWTPTPGRVPAGCLALAPRRREIS
eukprot:CAMPEP_0184704100 /NCGR_PEP_ID=MMETSP0313-20130426/30098_1 /TAXON_ID=2792 /ORGANISM="Porphyridium aerugineum, Strain SAG 1380-2" /LENGTH=146 /DNA_ID=CAMNT_0027165061 /DNA_START=164 /DNA_END=604 /DNA_ORIENTATION=+